MKTRLLTPAAILVLGLCLRLPGIHAPLLDHPGWRQGDTAAIARNFATLDLNLLHPQTDYDGPPPNYVELEMQIVPFLVAVLYKIFGIYEIFGRLISIAFSLGTIALCGFFANWLFESSLAGIVAAIACTIYPGSIYYGRTFMPDTAMTFFLTAAMYASARWIIEDDARSGKKFWLAAALTAAALLAKPVAAIGLLPILAMLIVHRGPWALLRSPIPFVFLVLVITPYVAYDAYLRSIAEWHWASGIIGLHVLPDLRMSLVSGTAFVTKFAAFRAALAMLTTTMLGGIPTALFGLAMIVPLRLRSYALLWAWFIAALAYAFVVVTVERVDYYLYPFLPLAALWTGGLAAALAAHLHSTAARVAVAVVGGTFALAALQAGHRAIAPYYRYNKTAYREAKHLAGLLPPSTLIVMGHEDPSILYYIGRKGWEEDPLLWTPFDEESAIRKGARYFVAIETNRLHRNAELNAWLARFPVVDPGAAWPLYETDPAKILPGAEERWKAFRRHESRASLPRRTNRNGSNAEANGPLRVKAGATPAGPTALRLRRGSPLRPIADSSPSVR